MIHGVIRVISATILCIGLGCGDDRGSGGDVSAAKIESTCKAYCEKARTCDDEVSMAECTADCGDELGDCMADEQAAAVSDLDNCAERSCDDFTGCTIRAGLQCAFGL